MSDTPRLDSRRRFGVPQDTSVLLLSGNGDQLCEYAVRFKTFTDTLREEMTEATHSVHVNRAKVLLCDQYFRLKRIVPAPHQDTRTYNGHPCIYAVFSEAYDGLDQAALRVVPPAFELPPRPPARKRVKAAEPPPDLLDEAMIHRLVFGDGTG